MLPELVVARLTGEVVSESTSAGTTGLLDLATGDWSPELSAAIGLPRSRLPAILPTGTRVGSWRAFPSTSSAVTTPHRRSSAALEPVRHSCRRGPGCSSVASRSFPTPASPRRPPGSPTSRRTGRRPVPPQRRGLVARRRVPPDLARHRSRSAARRRRGRAHDRRGGRRDRRAFLAPFDMAHELHDTWPGSTTPPAAPPSSAPPSNPWREQPQASSTRCPRAMAMTSAASGCSAAGRDRRCTSMRCDDARHCRSRPARSRPPRSGTHSCRGSRWGPSPSADTARATLADDQEVAR